MSSAKYSDKSLEELQPVVERYRENYKSLFGQYPEVALLTNKLEDLRKKKEQDLFNQVFGTMSPKNVADCISILTPPPLPYQDDGKWVKKKNSNNKGQT